MSTLGFAATYLQEYFRDSVIIDSIGYMEPIHLKRRVIRGPRDDLDVQLPDIFGNSVPIRNFKKLY